ncbi:MAG: DUF3085 domain-containing protein [Gammaproteobacteria bacterium]|nr:DUF3085 domain-containing protein [Gammaproteobacteria bacterium]
MTRLQFDMEQVAGLARHARAAPERRMTIAQRAEIYGEDRCAVPQPGEERLAPPCLWLVKDEGIYLMSPGVHPEPEPGDRPARAPVAYASGFDPTRDDRMAVWDRARDAVGGDDFAEAIPAEWVDAAVATRSPEFVLEFGPDAIGLLLPAASGDPSVVPPAP